MANSLQSFLDFGKFKFWAPKNNRVIGIDVGTSSVKVIQLRKEKGKAILRRMARSPLGHIVVYQLVKRLFCRPIN